MDQGGNKGAFVSDFDFLLDVDKGTKRDFTIDSCKCTRRLRVSAIRSETTSTDEAHGVCSGRIRQHVHVACDYVAIAPVGKVL